MKFGSAIFAYIEKRLVYKIKNQGFVGCSRASHMWSQIVQGRAGKKLAIFARTRARAQNFK